MLAECCIIATILFLLIRSPCADICLSFALFAFLEMDLRFCRLHGPISIVSNNYFPFVQKSVLGRGIGTLHPCCLDVENSCSSISLAWLDWEGPLGHASYRNLGPYQPFKVVNRENEFQTTLACGSLWWTDKTTFALVFLMLLATWAADANNGKAFIFTGWCRLTPSNSTYDGFTILLTHNRFQMLVELKRLNLKITAPFGREMHPATPKVASTEHRT